MHYKMAREAGEDLGPNVLPFERKKTCAEVNSDTDMQMLLTCTDEDLDGLCSDLCKLVTDKREEFYAALEAQRKALNEKSRRAGRG